MSSRVSSCRGGLRRLFVLAALGAAMPAGPAAAQLLIYEGPDGVMRPPGYTPGPRPGLRYVMLPPAEVQRRLRAMGYWQVGRPQLSGRHYAVTASDEEGMFGLRVDAYSGEVLNARFLGPPAPPAGTGRPAAMPPAAKPQPARLPAPAPLPPDRPAEADAAPVITTPEPSEAALTAPVTPAPAPAAPAVGPSAAAPAPVAAAPGPAPAAPAVTTGSGTATPGSVDAGSASVLSRP